MTLVEFIAPLKNSSHHARVLATLFYKKHFEDTDGLTVSQIRQALKFARASGASKVNVSDVLAKSGHLVDSLQADGSDRIWNLTETGEDHVRKILELPDPQPDVVHNVDMLTKLLGSISDQDVSDYIAESLMCLGVGALRATIVFLWSGAIRTLQQEMLKHGHTALNAAITKHDKKSRNVSRIDHFAYIKDRITILAAMELGLIDKNEKDTLIEALNLRNRSGHPGKYKPGIKKVSSFVEDLISIVFS